MPTSRSSRAQVLAGLRDEVFAVVALLGDQRLDLLVLARVQRREREVLELPLDRVDTEAVSQRGVDLERLARLLDLLLLGHRVDRAHVVQAVGELDQDDPHVGGHRDHHLAVVARLRLVARLEGDPLQLRDAVDDPRDLLAEALAHLLDRGGGVLDGVVQQRGAERLGVEAHRGADPRHADGVHDELLAGLAALLGVVLAGEHERVLDAGAVDVDGRVGGVLGDDREQVAQQPALRGAQAGRLRDLRPGGRRGQLDTVCVLGILSRCHASRVGDALAGPKRSREACAALRRGRAGPGRNRPAPPLAAAPARSAPARAARAARAARRRGPRRAPPPPGLGPRHPRPGSRRPPHGAGAAAARRRRSIR